MKAKVLNFAVGFPVLFGLWWVLSLQPKYSATVPSPMQVTATLFSKESLELVLPTWITIKVVGLCLVVSSIAGYAIGCAIGLSAIARTVLYVPASVFKSVPVSVFFPVFLTLFGLTRYVYPMLCMPVAAMVAVNIASAVTNMPPERVLQRQLLQLPLGPYLRDIVFWETVESFFATMRIAAPFCLTLQIALDYFLHTNGGLGAFINRRYSAYSYDRMYAAVLVVCLLGFAILFVTDRLSTRLQKWKTRKLN